MQCEDLFEALLEYIDGQLDPETTEVIRRHLEQCAVCELVIDNIRKTISAYHCDPAVEPPPTFRSHLEGLLHDRWEAKFSARGDGKSADGPG